MLYNTTDYDRTLGSGTDKTIDGKNVGGIQKGYRFIYDSVTDADGTQYLAIAGKNSVALFKDKSRWHY